MVKRLMVRKGPSISSGHMKAMGFAEKYRRGVCGCGRLSVYY